MHNRLLAQTAVIILLCITTLHLSAQSWQWGKRFGSTSNSSTENEGMIAMATDSHGNLYTLNVVMPFSPNAGGVLQTGYWLQDIMLCSYKCDGTLRWVNMIGANYEDYTTTGSLTIDRADNIILNARIPANYGSAVVHVGPGTTYAGGINFKKELVTAKYDSMGKVIWYKLIQDTVLPIANPCNYGEGIMGSACDNANNIYLTGFLSSRTPTYFNGNLPVNACGLYMFKLDAAGNYKSLMNLEYEIKYDGTYSELIVDDAHGRYYLWGIRPYNPPPPLHVGSVASHNQDSVASGSYLLAYNLNGKFLWKACAPNGNFSKPVIDKDGSIYITGVVQSGDSVNGEPVKSSYLQAPFAVKIDTNGKNAWLVNGIAQYGAYGIQIAVRNSGEVDLGGMAPRLSWPGCSNSIYQPLNSSYQLFIIRLNSQTGKALGFERGYVVIDRCETTCMTGDGKGNVYLGGSFVYDMAIGNDTLYSTGGSNDGMALKYGNKNCNCTPPELSYTYAFKKDSLSFKYSGTAGYKSILWDFGDGDSSTAAAPVHKFKDIDSVYIHTVCVTVTNNCGDNVWCQKIVSWPAAVPGANHRDNIHLYPNPVSDVLHIEGLVTDCTVCVMDITGHCIYNKTTDMQATDISMQAFPAGVYVFVATMPDGYRITKRFVKN
ncbi:MAG: T9SS type A sorting domain-containing protein [Bacteroidetes bacterium]|nr:T9SS type A sorting domain-containing protein [Bacteroidota bacterium]